MEVLCPSQIQQRNGCSPVQPASPTKVCDGPSQEAIHLHPFMIGPVTDTKVFLTISNGPKTLQLEPDLRDTVDQLKEQIVQERKFGGLGSFGLLYGSRELQGSEILGRQNVKNQATLFIVHKCNGG
ncbi:zinc finger protein 773-like protein [Platysternon megacephalum]|uniref:Zinc finger protein 773-like protein n=1 Tax=Platysternon megacephalum TaxID=55544 RepID=A0A4D9DXD8_9SAUR|nr:zinc finger protein 773-like protein [Platysternon megacephalum]